MFRYIPHRFRLTQTLRQMISIRFFFLVTCMSFTVSVIWIQFVDKQEFITVNESLIQEALENVARDFRYAEIYRKTDRLPKSLKFMLLWTQPDFAPFYSLGSGQRAFIERNCSTINCFVTADRNFFNGDLKKFDAIAFNGRNILDMFPSELPQHRSPNQKYIFFNMESADNYPICTDMFDDFFNWTSTYRLDSDIPYPYIQIRNRGGEVVGPNREMEWIEDPVEIDEELSYRLQNKSKAVAWFVSHCSSRSGRQDYVKKLQKALITYGLTVDIYGSCGPYKCPRHQQTSCDAILEKDYFFYLSFENSFSEDYVTEKLLTALQHEAVPIVLGGAVYSRFLPRGSYLDANKVTPQELASTIASVVQSQKLYHQFFRWRYHYTYHDPSNTDNVCAVCEALNNKSMMNSISMYRDFKTWWYPNYRDRCK